MAALLTGVVFIGLAVYAVLPFPWALNWGEEVILFLQGGLPILAVLIGLVAVMIGIADIKDRRDAKKEEAEEQKAEEEAGKPHSDGTQE